MINSILAHMRADDDLTNIIVMVPITEKLAAAIKRCMAILEENKSIMSSIKMSGSVVQELSFPSEQFAVTFRSDLPEDGVAIMVKYSLKAHKPIYTILEIEKENISLYAIDSEDCSYGYVFPVVIGMGDVLK